MNRPDFTWWIDQDKVLAGCFPGESGKGCEPRIKALLDLGVRVFVNLQEPHEVNRNGHTFPDYARVVKECQGGRTVAVERFPIADMGIPTVEVMTAIVERLRRAVMESELAYVHCWGGNGRTGTVAACYLVATGMTADAALQNIQRQRADNPKYSGKLAPQTPAQNEFVREWETRRGAQTRVGAGSGAAPDGPGRQASHAWKKPDADHIRGVLIGLAAGDAVGTTLEFELPGTFDPIDDMVGGGVFNLKPGEFTDDTSMAMCLAESIINKQTFDPINQLDLYTSWDKDGHFSSIGKNFDIGGQTSGALTEFAARRRPWCGPVDARSAGNGSLMRLGPVAMAWCNQPAAAMVYGGESSRTTHQDTQCVDACRYFAGLLVGALHQVKKETLLSPDYTPVAGMWDAQPLHPNVARVAAGSFLVRQPPDIRGTGYVVDCLEAALWAFANSGSFEEAILKAVNLGRDADTTGAVCGQIAGAYYGESGIPERWRSKLALWGDLNQLADGLVRFSDRGQ